MLWGQEGEEMAVEAIIEEYQAGLIAGAGEGSAQAEKLAMQAQIDKMAKER